MADGQMDATKYIKKAVQSIISLEVHHVYCQSTKPNNVHYSQLRVLETKSAPLNKNAYALKTPRVTFLHIILQYSTCT